MKCILLKVVDVTIMCIFSKRVDNEQHQLKCLKKTHDGILLHATNNALLIRMKANPWYYEKEEGKAKSSRFNHCGRFIHFT